MPRFASNGAFLGYIGSAIDITELRLAEERARDLSGRLIHAQEEKRMRLARDLHDDLSQSLALLSVELEMFGRFRSGIGVEPGFSGGVGGAAPIELRTPRQEDQKRHGAFRQE